MATVDGPSIDLRAAFLSDKERMEATVRHASALLAPWGMRIVKAERILTLGARATLTTEDVFSARRSGRFDEMISRADERLGQMIGAELYRRRALTVRQEPITGHPGAIERVAECCFIGPTLKTLWGEDA